MSFESEDYRGEMGIDGTETTKESIQANKKLLLEKMNRLSKKLGGTETFTLRSIQKTAQSHAQEPPQPQKHKQTQIEDPFHFTEQEINNKGSTPHSLRKAQQTQNNEEQRQQERPPFVKNHPSPPPPPLPTLNVQQVISKIRSVLAKSSSSHQSDVKTLKEIQALEHRLREARHKLQRI